jgi:hypothetical protein
MTHNKKFEEAARSRQTLALVFAILIHLAAFAAIYHGKMVPDFAKKFFNKDQPAAATNLP